MSLGAPLPVRLKGRAPGLGEQGLSAGPYVPISAYHFGDMRIEYVKEPESADSVGLFLYPEAMVDERKAHREFLPWKPREISRYSCAAALSPLVQFKLLGDSLDGFSQGITMRNSDTLSSLRYSRQEKIQRGDETEVITYLDSDRGYGCEHHLRYCQGDEALISFYDSSK